MATAALNKEVVETVTGVTLDLTKNEAQFLADILCTIGGDPRKSRRKHADDIATALSGQGFHYVSRFNVENHDIRGRLDVNDEVSA
jgi:hypothetical protein